MQKVIKTSFNLSEDDYKTLSNLAREKHVTMAEIVRQSLANFKFIEETQKQGGSILVQEKDKTMKRVVFR